MKYNIGFDNAFINNKLYFETSFCKLKNLNRLEDSGLVILNIIYDLLAYLAGISEYLEKIVS
jgi:hypothetical protein